MGSSALHLRPVRAPTFAAGYMDDGPAVVGVTQLGQQAMHTPQVKLARRIRARASPPGYATLLKVHQAVQVLHCPPAAAAAAAAITAAAAACMLLGGVQECTRS